LISFLTKKSFKNEIRIKKEVISVLKSNEFILKQKIE